MRVSVSVDIIKTCHNFLLILLLLPIELTCFVFLKLQVLL